jgi:hypothetical protein
MKRHIAAPDFSPHLNWLNLPDRLSTLRLMGGMCPLMSKLSLVARIQGFPIGL